MTTSEKERQEGLKSALESARASLLVAEKKYQSMQDQVPLNKSQLAVLRNALKQFNQLKANLLLLSEAVLAQAVPAAPAGSEDVVVVSTEPHSVVTEAASASISSPVAAVPPEEILSPVLVPATPSAARLFAASLAPAIEARNLSTDPAPTLPELPPDDITQVAEILSGFRRRRQKHPNDNTESTSPSSSKKRRGSKGGAVNILLDMGAAPQNPVPNQFYDGLNQLFFRFLTETRLKPNQEIVVKFLETLLGLHQKVEAIEKQARCHGKVPELVDYAIFLGSIIVHTYQLIHDEMIQSGVIIPRKLSADIIESSQRPQKERVSHRLEQMLTVVKVFGFFQSRLPLGRRALSFLDGNPTIAYCFRENLNDELKKPMISPEWVRSIAEWISRESAQDDATIQNRMLGFLNLFWIRETFVSVISRHFNLNSLDQLAEHDVQACGFWQWLQNVEKAEYQKICDVFQTQAVATASVVGATPEDQPMAVSRENICRTELFRLWQAGAVPAAAAPAAAAAAGEDDHMNVDGKDQSGFFPQF